MKFIENAPTYKNLSRTPLQIDVHLASPVILYQPLALDGLLAAQVVQQATRGRGLPATPEPYDIPLPLELLWRCPETLAPLWNATQFFPLEKNVQCAAFWHKRGYRPEMLQLARSGKPHNANFQNGRHKEYRIPLPKQSCLKWRAYCVGDVAEIEDLLGGLHSVGKKRTQGFGRVLKWQIAAVKAFDYVQDGRLIKAFPVAYPETSVLSGGAAFSRYETAWTPPYWNAVLYRECIC